jgi:hypothetical protein
MRKNLNTFDATLRDKPPCGAKRLGGLVSVEIIRVASFISTTRQIETEYSVANQV